jgi:membrane protein implicated in regulation of membrane protease activity
LDDKFWYWWAAGVAMIVLAIFAPTPFFLWWAVAAFVMGFVAWFFPILNWQVELLLYAIMAVGVVIARQRYRQLHPIISADPFLNQPVTRHIGTTLILTKAITNGSGRVNIEGNSWAIKGEDMPEGTKVKVTGAEGSTLIVERSD